MDKEWVIGSTERYRVDYWWYCEECKQPHEKLLWQHLNENGEWIDGQSV